MHHLAAVQQEFDEKDNEEYEEDAEIYRLWYETGNPPEGDKNDFSSRHVASKMAVTRKLIVAEKA